MIKRILQFFLFLTVCISAHSQALTYNAIATAYVTTTISQHVVFDSNMQQGGTFTFSVLAHNGGGRAGQSDTANVKIEFFNSGGGLITQAATSYNSNLPNPNAVCGNPCIDTSVPWSTLSISSTLSSAQASQVAYAKVSMYGVDGSYWAGDYGPWYRAPTLQRDGGGNLLYNPEFGPYNGLNAQGWTTNPGMGSCQGAWGGSNPCIVNSDGVPGSSTVGLVANANGGGPSPTGGTTSGTAGGYNSTMSVTNAGTGATSGAPAPAPTPTVTGTTVTYTTRNVVSGNTTTVYRTPVTTTTYSDGTSTSANGTETLYQTKVASNVVTNKIVNGVLTTTTTPINKVTTGGVTTIEANGVATTTTQNVQQGLTYRVYDFDAYTYNCGWLGCIKNLFGPYREPNLSPGAYNQVATGRTSSGMYVPTNGSFPAMGDGTLVAYKGTITAPVTVNRPAGTVYRLYFYSNSDDGFVMDINGQNIINDRSTNQWQSIGGYTASGWMDVVAGQTYNIEAWYWQDVGGYGLRFQWDYGAGRLTVPNSAFTTGWITETNTVDTTGLVYSNNSVIDMSGTSVNLGPTVEGGTITQNNSPSDQVIGSGSGGGGISSEQQTRVDTWRNGTQGVDNFLHIEQVSGNYNNINVTQSGGKNTMYLGINGDSNTINNSQSGSNYLNNLVQGNSNSMTSSQSNTGGSHYQETKIMSGNNNNISVLQKDNGSNIMFNTITGSNNSITAVQEGTGGHYLENVLMGNGHTVIVNQSGTTANNANINLTNGGGASSVDLQQTGGKNFTIIQNCMNPAGCSTVVRQ